MKWCIETTDHEVLEVTNLFTASGVPTENLFEADRIVIKFSETNWQMVDDIGPAPVHRVH